MSPVQTVKLTLTWLNYADAACTFFTQQLGPFNSTTVVFFLLRFVGMLTLFNTNVKITWQYVPFLETKKDFTWEFNLPLTCMTCGMPARMLHWQKTMMRCNFTYQRFVEIPASGIFSKNVFLLMIYSLTYFSEDLFLDNIHPRKAIATCAFPPKWFLLDQTFKSWKSINFSHNMICNYVSWQYLVSLLYLIVTLLILSVT